MMGNFEEITQQGFNVDEILAQYSKVTQKQDEKMASIKQNETSKQ